MVEEYLWGLYRSVIDATLHGTAVVVVYSTIKGGKKKWESSSSSSFFIMKRMADLSSVGGRLHSHLVIYVAL
jgi:hypothetical protein